MEQTTDGGSSAAREAVADLQHDAFEGAKRMVELARVILAGDEAAGHEEPLVVAAPAQATREPSSDTVQKPAGE